MSSVVKLLSKCIFDLDAGEAKDLTPAEKEAKRIDAIRQYRTLLANLRDCGLTEAKAVVRWERQVAREERRRARAEKERLEKGRGPLPAYSETAKPAEKVLEFTA